MTYLLDSCCLEEYKHGDQSTRGIEGFSAEHFDMCCCEYIGVDFPNYKEKRHFCCSVLVEHE